jgi:hypothetical protein
MAVSILLPFSGKRMIVISFWQKLIICQRLDNSSQVVNHHITNSTLENMAKVSFESTSVLNPAH